MFKSKIVAALLTILIFQCVNAETYIVSPGDSSLEDAYAAASNGDTIILPEGTYTTSTGTLAVNKSLTFTSPSANETPIIDFTILLGNSTIEKLNITFQGLNFTRKISSPNEASGGFGGHSFIFVENTFQNYLELLYVNNIVLIGNSSPLITPATDYRFTFECDGVCFFAANSFGSRVKATSQNSSGIYFVGNNVVINSKESSDLFFSNKAFVIGNRFKKVQTGYVSSPVYFLTISGTGQIQNNIFQLENYNNYISLKALSGSKLLIKNNVFDVDSSAIGALTDTPLLNNSYSIFSSNIILNSPVSIFSSGSTNDIKNNICFNSLGSCGDQSINLDPKFIDLIDYKLDSESPAIDNGVLGLANFDLDGTRNDMGVYGGSFSIDQFDKQRADDFLGPYIFPMFFGSGAVTDGNVGVKVITAAKLPRL